jgi:hypothetical protein
VLDDGAIDELAALARKCHESAAPIVRIGSP